MFQLRWLEKETGKKLMNEHGFYYMETVKILQYRTKEAVTDYTHIESSGSFRTELAWTPWTDVPTVEERQSTWSLSKTL